MKELNKNNGTWHLQISSYEELNPIIEYFAKDRDFVFRGHQNSEWKITSTLERYLNSINPILKNDSIFKFQLDNFKRNLRGKYILENNLDDNEIWALGRHYGLHTPLIDWSKSFFIALYFAFIESQDSEDGNRTVYSIHKTEIKKKQEFYNDEKFEYEKFEFIEPLIGDNYRMVNQNGLFTKMPLGFDFEEWIFNNFSDQTDPCVFFKIDIPNSLRIQILNILDLMNINPGTIYPDLFGASLNANHTLLLTEHKFNSQN